MTSRFRTRRIAPPCVLIALTILISSGFGCERDRARQPEVRPGASDQLPVRTTGIQAGPLFPEATIRNPYQGDVHAIKQGEQYYTWFNCAGCHGAIGGGSIGPPLMDSDWIYGGQPENILQSIMQGRPNGMPAYGNQLSEDAAWRLVAFVQSLGGTPSKQPPGATTPKETKQTDEQTQERANE